MQRIFRCHLKLFLSLVLTMYIFSSLLMARNETIYNGLPNISLLAQKTGMKNVTTGEGATKNRASVSSKTLRDHQISSMSSSRVQQFHKKDCSVCFPHNFSIIVENNAICSTKNQIDMEVEIIILISTAHERKKYRDILRKTWLAYSKHNTGRIRYAFLSGSKNNITTNILKNEILEHRDIILGTFPDLYENTTQKAIMALKWATSNCSGANYFMKVNDDVFINIPALLSILRNRPGEILQTMVGGNCKIGTHFDPEFKFCSSTAYIMGMNVARNINQKLAQQPFYVSEEMLIARSIKKIGYGISALPGFKVNVEWSSGEDLCKFKRDNYISASGLTPEVMSEIWNQKCDKDP